LKICLEKFTLIPIGIVIIEVIAVVVVILPEGIIELLTVCLFVKRAFAYDVIISTYGFVYAETMGKPRMLYIRNFYVV